MTMKNCIITSVLLLLLGGYASRATEEQMALPEPGTGVHLCGSLADKNSHKVYTFKTSSVAGVELGLLSEQDGAKLELYRLHDGKRESVSTTDIEENIQLPVGYVSAVKIPDLEAGDYILKVDGAAGDYVCTVYTVPGGNLPKVVAPADTKVTNEAPTDTKVTNEAPTVEESEAKITPPGKSRNQKEPEIPYWFWIVIGVGGLGIGAIVMIFVLRPRRAEYPVQPERSLPVDDSILPLEAREDDVAEDSDPIVLPEADTDVPKRSRGGHAAIVNNAADADCKLEIRANQQRLALYLNFRMLERSGSLYIGRSSASHICVADCKVSSRHLELLAKQGKLYLRDVGSKNGTIVRGHRVPALKLIPLQSRDSILVGDVTLTVLYK